MRVCSGYSPRRILASRGAVPYAESGDSILVAVGDPYDLDLAAELSLATGRSVQPVLADPQEISKVLKHRFGVGSVALNDELDESESAVDDSLMGPNLMIWVNKERFRNW